MRGRSSGRRRASTQVVGNQDMGALAQERFISAGEAVDPLVAIVAQHLVARRGEIPERRLDVPLHVQKVNPVRHFDGGGRAALRQAAGRLEEAVAQMNLGGKVKFLIADLAGTLAAESCDEIRRRRPGLESIDRLPYGS